MTTPASPNPVIQVGKSRGNAIINPQPGMFIEPVIVVDNNGNALSISQGGAIPTYTVLNPQTLGVYDFSIAAQIGVVTSNTFMTIFNPVSSTRVIIIGGVFISTSNSGSSGTTNPMRGWRFYGQPTGGTLEVSTGVSSVVTKLVNAYPDPVAELRINNPTVTLATAIFNTPSAVTNGVGGGTFVHQVEVPPAGGPFVLLPNEGIAINNAGGTANQVWNISIVWAEAPIVQPIP